MNETRASVENFELDRHAVVEASAGTGKTYTIEQLVMRLVTEENVPFEKILVVTFTEKATGELKTRLRDMLLGAIETHPEHAPILRSALDRFDQAPIFTIHGFCQRLLQEHALEQGQDFRFELANDPDLLETLLREIQRKHWRKTFGAKLKTVLECALYERGTAGDWERKVLDIAGKFKPRSGHQLRPECVADWWQRIDEAGADWTGQLEIFTIQTLAALLRDYKRQRGLVSFDDMIATVEESLDPAHNPDAESFRNALRERYHYGIVDEFQDTDPLQWNIFRRIFLEGGDSKLFIVGDPKQAIFGFRGADLPTYLDAARQMKADFGAEFYPLSVNWRSDPDLIEALNCLFVDGDWFPRALGIECRKVDPPDDDRHLMRVSDDRTDRPALTLVDLADSTTMKLAQKSFARFVVSEIQRQLAADDGPRLTIALKNKPPRPINAGDFCILVKKRTDAAPIIQLLDIAGIPYSFYKQTGLWQSEEAIHVEILLRTLARREDRAEFRKALLTCFFRVPPEALARLPDLPMSHPARQLYERWLGHAEERQWSALCHSLLEDTGLLFHDPTQGDAERRLTNLRQILARLEQAGLGGNLDLLGLIDWIVQQRSKRDASEAEMQPVEMDRPRVKIMTIHASKGLEFPIVFLAGGFTQAQISRKGSCTYRDDAGRVVFDLRPESDAWERIAKDQLSEHRRLLYVALTRAIFKLYLPMIKVPTRKQWMGPVGTVLLPALEQACPDKLGPLIADIVRPPVLAITRSAAPTAAAPDAPAPFQIDGPLFPALDEQLGRRRVVIRSFSSMARHHLAQVGAGTSFGETAPPADEEPIPKQERDDPLRGAVFGDMVHNILEQIDFAEVGRASAFDDLIAAGTHARKLMDAEIRGNVAGLRTRLPREQLEQACRVQIAPLVFNCLRTPLKAAGLRLCDVAAKDRLHEVEFQYPVHAGPAVSADVRPEDAFITGFIDLLFRAEGKFYLVDFKTNLLSGYGQEPIERCMQESDYHRQYQLYLHAAKRWLERVHGRRFNFQKQFGGVYYLFVRGLNSLDDSAGVYFHEPSKNDLDLDRVLSR